MGGVQSLESLTGPMTNIPDRATNTSTDSTTATAIEFSDSFHSFPNGVKDATKENIRGVSQIRSSLGFPVYYVKQHDGSLCRHEVGSPENNHPAQIRNQKQTPLMVRREKARESPELNRKTSSKMDETSQQLSLSL